jgi:hypothetical protein
MIINMLDRLSITQSYERARSVSTSAAVTRSMLDAGTTGTCHPCPALTRGVAEVQLLILQHGLTTAWTWLAVGQWQ